MKTDVKAFLDQRFSDAPSVPEEAIGNVGNVIESMAERGSCRQFADHPIQDDLLQTLCAIALSSPTKSDLQQRDIVILRSVEKRQKLTSLLGDQTWVDSAPVLLIFCGNNRRQRQIHEWKEVPFANDHLDAFFNAVGDAAIALGAFVTAAESIGLGCCPISAVRNEASAISDLLSLPQHVFPFAGLAVGYLAVQPKVSQRLPLSVTCHWERFSEAGIEEKIAEYDNQRERSQPYSVQRQTTKFGTTTRYGWSDDKVRQYSVPERADFGKFVRDKGFNLD